jgi:type IV pilus assembly protein PilA
MGYRHVSPRAQDGFTLMEVLIVMLVIGLLAAIAIPVFLGQQGKAHDSGAKSAVNRVAKQVEACRVEHSSYAECDEKDELDGAPDVDWGQQPGQAGVLKEATSTDGYIAYAVSEGKTNGKNHVYAWMKDPSGVTKRLCVDTSLAALDSGGCSGGAW